MAMAAQGFCIARPECVPDARHYRRVLKTLGLLQLDFVNVLVPAHYLVVYSRLGSYDRGRFDEFVYGNREYTEQWAHEASIVPVDTWPLLAHRRAAWTPSKHNPILKIRNRKRYLIEVLEQVARDGALTASELPKIAGTKRRPGDWHRSVPRWALEYHFSRGKLAVAGRKPNFQRIYDLPERVIPGEHLVSGLGDDDARRELLRRASSALGIATLQDLADYYRMSAREAAPLVDELVEAGALSAVTVDGWSSGAYIAADARLPRCVAGASLLSPFDPLVWYRPRAERLFEFHYRIEIYVPADKRRWGYYVLPFRLGSDIVARVDLKAERQSSELLVRRAHLEQNHEATEVSSALALELRSLADWLMLERVTVHGRTRFERVLREDTCQTQPA